MSTEIPRWRSPTRWAASQSPRRALTWWIARFLGPDNTPLAMLSIDLQEAELELRSESGLFPELTSWDQAQASMRARTIFQWTTCRSMASGPRRNSSRTDRKKETWKHLQGRARMRPDCWSEKKDRSTQWETISPPRGCCWTPCLAQGPTSSSSSPWLLSTGKSENYTKDRDC